ncbi:MAG: hypothetical protein E7610_07120 [Ruminococcaceae bacterium]|nr:hypothetical protein [Oscillospiraceae bacterium]
MAWYHVPGNRQDTVISTQVRFSRNIAAYPFPSRLDASRAREIIAEIGTVLEGNGFTRIDFTDVSRTAAQSLLEKHYATPAALRESLPHALFLNEPCNLSAMACEEDHLRLQCILAGFALRDAYEGACKIESLLDASLEFAFDKRLGYLTENPANLGTALRVSVLLCLPLLTDSKRMETVSLQLSQGGLILRELQGDGEPPRGLYRLSNRVCLGVTEEEILERMELAVERLTAAESELRSRCIGADLDILTDRVRRSEGILRYAHALSARELPRYLTDLRLGAALGLTEVRIEALTSLLVEAMPATLTLSAKESPTRDHERDILRAALVKDTLFGA